MEKQLLDVKVIHSVNLNRDHSSRFQGSSNEREGSRTAGKTKHQNLKERKVKDEYELLVAMKVPIREVGVVKDEWGECKREKVEVVEKVGVWQDLWKKERKGDQLVERETRTGV